MVAYWDQAAANAVVAATSPTNALCCWSFKNHLFVGDVGANNDRIQWSDAIDPTVSIIPVFTVATTTQAGDAFLSETPGEIICGEPIGRSCMIYKNNSAYICDFVGGNFVFQFRLASAKVGAASRHAVANLGDEHIVLTPDDVIITNGRDFRSIADGWVRRAIINAFDADLLRQAWCIYNRPEKEVWICGAATSDAPDLAFVYNLTSQSWGTRTLGRSTTRTGFTAGALGIALDSGAAFEWDTVSGTWATTTLTWDESFFSSDTEVMLVAEATAASDGVFSQVNVGTTRSNSGAITSDITRRRLDLGDTDTVKTINRVYINGDFQSGSEITVIVRGYLYDGAVADFKLVTFDPYVKPRADVLVSGRFFDVEIYAEDGNPMIVSGLSFDVVRQSMN